MAVGLVEAMVAASGEMRQPCDDEPRFTRLIELLTFLKLGERRGAIYDDDIV